MSSAKRGRELLDPGHYGPLTITGPVTIDGNGFVAITAPSGNPSILVTAGSGGRDHRSLMNGHSMNDLVLAIMDLDTQRMLDLLKSGAMVNVVDDGHTPLQWAASARNYPAVKALLEHGADPNFSGEPDSTTALHFAANASTEMVELLCDAGAQPNSRNDVGMTPIMVAAKEGRLDVVKELIKYGAVANIYDEQMRTPLHWSATGGDYADLNSYLIEVGVDPLAKTDYGLSYLDILKTMKSRHGAS